MEYFVLAGQQQIGPITAEELSEKLHRGEVSPASLVWHSGQPDWQPLCEVLPTIADADLQPVANPSSALQNASGNVVGRTWLDNSLVTIPALLICFPLGLVPLWFSNRFTLSQKLTLSFLLPAVSLGHVLFLGTILSVGFQGQSVTSPNANANQDSAVAVYEEAVKGLNAEKSNHQIIKSKLAGRARNGRLKISAADFGEAWPFSVNSGVLQNRPQGPVNLITFEAPDGRVFAINGSAQSEMSRRGWRDSSEIYDPNRGGYLSAQLLIDLGLLIRPN